MYMCGAVLLCMCVLELCCDVCVCWNCGVMYVYILELYCDVCVCTGAVLLNGVTRGFPHLN